MPITFVVHSSDPASTIKVAPTEVILAGFSARSVEERDRHVDELRRLGVEPPTHVPAFWRVARYLLTVEDVIEVQGERTSGEVEFALVAHGGDTYVTVASDQTDREVEATSIPRSKQLCPKVLAAEVLPIAVLRDRWDDIELSSDVSADGRTWLPYQRAHLSALIGPDALVRAAGYADGPPDGAILLSGTVPVVDGVIRYLPHFRASLSVPDGPCLRLSYRVDAMQDPAPGRYEAAS